jgi:hypothetical protein
MVIACFRLIRCKLAVQNNQFWGFEKVLKTNAVLLTFVSVFVALFSQKDLQAQSATNLKYSPELGCTYEIGRILRIYPDLPAIDYTGICRLDIDFNTYGAQWWNKAYGYPTLGCQLASGWLGNNDVLGAFFAVVPNLRFKLFAAKHNEFYTRVGMGFAYFTKPYNRETNPGNMLIGSAITNITSLQFMYSRALSPSYWVNAGVGFLHFSNGHTQLPNVGLNMPSLQLGISIREFGTPIVEPTKEMNVLASNELTMDAIVGLGFHEFGETTEPTGGIKYPVYSFGLALSRNLGTIHVVQLGFTYTYYTSFRDYIVNQSFFNEQLSLNASTFALYAGHEFVLGQFGLDLKLGMYLYNPFRRKYNREVLDKPNGFKDISTNKLGINFYFSDTRLKRKGLYMGMHIKANLGQADFAEFSMGYRF